MKLQTTNLLLLVFLSISCFGQIDQYNYQHEIQGITDTWHTIKLPNAVFAQTNTGLSDVRIFGITAKDTIEAPFLLQRTKEEVKTKEVKFKRLNTASNPSGHYVTFEVPTKGSINRIKTSFRQTNFDWKVKLEGSQNQNEWFTILEDYRILSIATKQTNFQYTDLNFPAAKYRYYRIQIKSKQKPELLKANLLKREVTLGAFQKHSNKSQNFKENKKDKQTEIEIDLGMPLSVSHLNLTVKNKFDYYRPITIQALIDSVKTKDGMHYNYRTLTNGTLNSLTANDFSFRSTVTQKLKITINNQDNQPLIITDVAAKGYLHKLVARFTEPGNYFLVYGNKKASFPQYDIKRFASKIPETPVLLTLGSQVATDKSQLPEQAVTKPLFENSIWLWGIMIFIILLLGGFTISMIRKS